MRTIIIGLGNQGHKRRKAAGSDVVATVDPINPEADYKALDDPNLPSFDAALVCTPDENKIDLLFQLISQKKHVLVEKPLLADQPETLEKLQNLANKNKTVCYTAYNHRFEPHFIKMAALLKSGELGKIYALRLFYGNGTARLVRNSAWRDQAAGILPDLGSHLLDTLLYWFGADAFNFDFTLRGAFRHENRSFDHVIIESTRPLSVQLEMSMLSWKNHFTCDVYAENASAHIDSLCKWGPSRFTTRTRILPAGRPPEEMIQLVQDDPTWNAEYQHFCNLCRNNENGNLHNDIWINAQLKKLAAQAGVENILPQGQK